MNASLKRDSFSQEFPAVYDVTVDATGVIPLALPNTFIPTVVEALVETAFNGTSPTMKAGWTGTLAALFDTTDIDLTQTGVQIITCRQTAPLSADKEIILTVVEGSSSAGKVHLLFKGWVKDPFLA